MECKRLLLAVVDWLVLSVFDVDTFIIIKHILIECADSVEVRKIYFEERSLYLLFRNVNPKKMFVFLKEIGVF